MGSWSYLKQVVGLALATGLMASAVHAADPPLVRSKKSGQWSAPDTWSDGRVPASGDRVIVGAGHSVIYDVESRDVPANGSTDAQQRTGAGDGRYAGTESDDDVAVDERGRNLGLERTLCAGAHSQHQRARRQCNRMRQAAIQKIGLHF